MGDLEKGLCLHVYDKKKSRRKDLKPMLNFSWSSLIYDCFIAKWTVLSEIKEVAILYILWLTFRSPNLYGFAFCFNDS